MSGEAVESQRISFVAGVAKIRSKPSRSGSASLAVQKGKMGEYLKTTRVKNRPKGHTH